MTGISGRLEAKIRRDFERGSVELVLARLVELLPDTLQDRERIQAAVVVIADGSYERFEDAVKLAVVDWRDVLVSADLAGEHWPQRLDDAFGKDHDPPERVEST